MIGGFFGAGATLTARTPRHGYHLEEPRRAPWWRSCSRTATLRSHGRGPIWVHFNDPLFEAWTQRPILIIAEGRRDRRDQGDGARIPEGDRDAWYREWTATADRLYAQAEECATRGARISARYLYQRASTYYRTSYPLLFGRPIDPRVKSGYAREA